MNKFLSNITSLPKYQIVLLAVLPIGGLIAAFTMLLLQPMLEDLDKVRNDIDGIKSKISTSKTIAAQLPKFEEELKNLEAKLEESIRQLPEEREIPNLLTSIASLAKEKNLEIVKFRPGAEVRREFYADVPVDIKVFGNFHDIVLFFQAVGDLERIVNIGGLQVSKAGSKAKDGSLAVDLLATTFRFIEKKGAK